MWLSLLGCIKCSTQSVHLAVCVARVPNFLDIKAIKSYNLVKT